MAFHKESDFEQALIELLSKKGHERLGIIVPLVYEDRYKKIIKENWCLGLP